MDKFKLTKNQSKSFLGILGICFLLLIKRFSRYGWGDFDAKMIAHFLFLLSLIVSGAFQLLRVILEPAESEEEDGSEEKENKELLAFFNNKHIVYFFKYIPFILFLVYASFMLFYK